MCLNQTIGLNVIAKLRFSGKDERLIKTKFMWLLSFNSDWFFEKIIIN